MAAQPDFFSSAPTAALSQALINLSPAARAARTAQAALTSWRFDPTQCTRMHPNGPLSRIRKPLTGAAAVRCRRECLANLKRRVEAQLVQQLRIVREVVMRREEAEAMVIEDSEDESEEE